MPVTYLTVRWGATEARTYYSPSTVIRDYFQAGESYSSAAFLARCQSALQAASERVREKFGHPCSAAAATLAEIERDATCLGSPPGTSICILELSSSHPGAQ